MADPLVLPEHPTDNDTWFCFADVDQIIVELEKTGIDGNPTSMPDNPNRVLAKYLLPLTTNLLSVMTTLRKRAQIAKRHFLQSPTDVEFDHVQLKSTIEQIERLRNDVMQYHSVVLSSAGLSEAEQRKRLAPLVYSPLFLGSGHETIGDLESPWVETGGAVWCQPLRRAVDLEDAIGWHVDKWSEMAKRKPGQRLMRIALGALVIAGLGYGLSVYGRRRY